MFDVATGGISIYDPVTQIIANPYGFDQGKRFDSPPRPLGPGLTSHVIRSRAPLRLGTNEEAAAYSPVITGSDEAESWLGVPILAGDRVLGVIALERVPQHAFTDADERVLSTLASSMGVALENARLFDETKRLLTRAPSARPSCRSSTASSRASPSKLDMQQMYDLVGDKIQEIFDAQVVDIARLRRRPQEQIRVRLYDRAWRAVSRTSRCR